MLGDEVIDYYVDNMVGVPNRADEKKGVKTTLTSAPMASQSLALVKDLPNFDIFPVALSIVIMSLQNRKDEH